VEGAELKYLLPPGCMVQQARYKLRAVGASVDVIRAFAIADSAIELELQRRASAQVFSCIEYTPAEIS
jgi:hypothetical protein